MTEVSCAVRNVLANELPQMVRHAVSESLNELLTTTPLKGAAKSNSSKHPAIEAKPKKRKAALKKPALKKTAAKKTTSKKPSAKKTSRKNTDNGDRYS
jgi:hypothetical protein